MPNEDNLLPFPDKALRPQEAGSPPSREEINVVLEDTDEPAGPWSPNPVIDRYLAPIRIKRIQEAREEFCHQIAEEYRAKYPPWWARLRAWLRRWIQA